MKNFKTTVIIVVIALYSQFANSQTTSKAANLPRSFKMGLNRAFGEYIELKDALLQKDIKKANHEAKELLDAANAIKTDSLTKDQQSEFNKYIGKVTLNAQHISEATNLPHQLEHFDYTSDAIYALMKYFKPTDKTLYYNFCPMANKGDGAHWVSDKKDLNNPYMAGSIMGCEKQQDKF